MGLICEFCREPVADDDPPHMCLDSGRGSIHGLNYRFLVAKELLIGLTLGAPKTKPVRSEAWDDEVFGRETMHWEIAQTILRDMERLKIEDTHDR